MPLCSVLTKGTSAEVQIAIRQAVFAGSGARTAAIPLEPFSTNKEMGRILIRRGGETIAAGKCPINSLCDTVG
jgi:elongation factor 1 alpha-like protein